MASSALSAIPPIVPPSTAFVLGNVLGLSTAVVLHVADAALAVSMKSLMTEQSPRRRHDLVGGLVRRDQTASGSAELCSTVSNQTGPLVDSGSSPRFGTNWTPQADPRWPSLFGFAASRRRRRDRSTITSARPTTTSDRFIDAVERPSATSDGLRTVGQSRARALARPNRDAHRQMTPAAARASVQPWSKATAIASSSSGKRWP